MSSCANSPGKGGHTSQADTEPTSSNLDEWPKSPAKADEEEDEDEDVDFNPFLKETPSPDASSSLSSEIEGIDGDAVENGVRPLQTAEICSSELTDEGPSFVVEDSEHCEGGNLVLDTLSPKLVCEQELPELVAGSLSKTDSEILSQAENGHLQGKEDYMSRRPDSHGDMVEEATNSWKLLTHSDDEDAICKRTRARYSLASFTLDELESFLQETDDDDDIQNVDDEEEYKKFLAAVLLGVDGDGHPTPETANVDDEDEDNDADFEIELEEALESDLDDRPSDKTTKGNYECSRRRPETRQNRGKNTSAECKKKLLQHGKRPLRPLLPLVPVGSTSYLPALSGQPSMADAPLNYASLTANAGCINGFAPNQIGQLYCLIHEHVQLLIQIYSLCVLDPPRQHIASQVEELILQMLHKRDQMVARRSIPYPSICFSPAYVCSSTSEGSKRSNMAQHTLVSAPTLEAQRVTSSTNNQMLATLNDSQGQGHGEYAGSQALGSRAVADSVWLPNISGPVLSVLDVAPLNLVKTYIDDLRIVVKEQRRWHVESTCDIRSEREPLFPISSSLSAVEVDIQVLSGASPSNARTGSPSSGHHPLKRSLAAAIVESAKKQSVALVERDVAKLAQIFFPVFNRALFPHKPPPSAVANRVLFTDAEDELLALGIMEFNTDWKAIQQRFLPCKSKHQIFVRQKNRCSSKAPENPIKAVRRMKTSPLTAEEIQYIQEGFKIYKLDWMSVCKFIVPHRDPSLLPRQWRVALGTQKSYKQNPTKKEKRRAYEAERRRRRSADQASWLNASEKDYQVEHAGAENSCEDDCVDDPEEAYVHEGFLVDWRPGPSSHTSFKQPRSYVGKGGLHGMREEAAYDIHYETQCHAGSTHQFPIASSFQNTYSASRVIHNNMHGALVPFHPVSDTSFTAPKSPFGLLSNRGRQTDNARLVKLAPNLPPVNLPQNVRVISQYAYLSRDGAASTITESADNRPCHAAKVGDMPATQQSKSRSLNDSVACFPREESRVFKEKTINEERGIDSDSQMHPLLFQVPEDGRLPYYPSNCNTLAPAPISFSCGSQPQLNLSLFHSPHQLNNDRSFRPRDSASDIGLSGIDFHPLLQGTEEVNTDLTSANSTAHQPVSDAVLAKVPASGGSLTPGTDLSSCVDRASELDLDIHLSSSSILEKAIGRNAGATHKLVLPIKHSTKSGTLLKGQQTSGPFDEQPENLSSVRSDLISGSQMSSRPNDAVQCNMDLAGDESHPGIVMEQEELSDSDEEMEEHVEFECEEMADSEGEEESSMEIVADTYNRSSAAEKVVVEDHQPGLGNGCRKSNDAAPGNSSLPSLKLGLTCEGGDTASKSWLSLDPRLRGCPNPTVETQARKNCSPRPNRSCKKTKTCIRNNIEQVHDQATEAAKQLDLGTSTIPNKRPRKRTCRSNANPEVGIAM
ncbi:uncharacterized protein LOC115725896 isoform X3 [Rhodamnia argentea]|uniref:Uncharacterized protein LOC115725896 isoform X3 n=1 Tax=Rhodamnia argentea TaxID=178133 RepID=A0ABM3H5G7_9MYRT|nr:uncharacterized protein LOC115725896 isoform X3 [Rhodamnia argentea]